MKMERSDLLVRLWVLRGVLFAFLLVLAGRLWYLQIFKGKELTALAERNRIRRIAVPPPRGIIYDRHLRPLARNRLSYHLVILPQAQPAEEWPLTLARIRRIVEVKPERLRELEEKLRDPSQLPLLTISVKADLTPWELARLAERLYDLPGAFLEARVQREYPQGPLAAHVLGYVGEISPSELQRLKEKGYRMGDIVGKSGLERQYEPQLRGQAGQRLILVDARNRFVSFVEEGEGVQGWFTQRSLPPQPGLSLRLHLDSEIQRAAEEALKGRRGAVVVVNPQNGAVLAMASQPSFDPNLFIPSISLSDWQRLLRSPEHPLLHRAAAGLYPPGSAFKPVVALAALAEGVITPATSFHCSGVYHLGRWPFGCWSVHGTVSLLKGIARSCDVYFYQVGQRVGPERIARYAQAFGLGRELGLDLPDERAGWIPTPDWKRQRYGEPWYPGDMVNISIGQGMIAVTPLEMAMAASVFANKGLLYRPRLVEAILSPEGEVVQRFEPEVLARLKAPDSAWEQVRRGMWEAVNMPYGTGRAAQLPGITMAGKTGSAETRRGLKTHAWFLCFAPYEAPQVALAVVVEHAGHGGAVAAPIARQVLATFFHLPSPQGGGGVQED